MVFNGSSECFPRSGVEKLAAGCMYGRRLHRRRPCSNTTACARSTRSTPTCPSANMSTNQSSIPYVFGSVGMVTQDKDNDLNRALSVAIRSLITDGSAEAHPAGSGACGTTAKPHWSAPTTRALHVGLSQRSPGLVSAVPAGRGHHDRRSVSRRWAGGPRSVCSCPCCACCPAPGWLRIVPWVIRAYVDLFRGLPVIVTLFIIYSACRQSAWRSAPTPSLPARSV